MSRLSGILNINKEKGYTSSDAVSVVRKALGYVKAGHTGTLDPEAEGVLPVCVGKATKIADYIGGGKQYRAGIKLGIITDTDDLTGRILEERPVNADRNALESAARQFMGKSMQTPPMYSAVKIGGKKLYELARAGKTADRVPREINIPQIRIMEYDPETHTAVMEVACSKGTYIRSLCSDIGRVLGCGACMGALTRTRSGPFTLDGSITPDILREYITAGRIHEILYTIEEVLKYKTVAVPARDEKRVINGGSFHISDEDAQDGSLVFAAVNGITAGIYVRDGDWYKPRVMLIGEPE